MRVLIDTAGLSPGAPSWIRDWWREILPLVVAGLEADILLLQRSDTGWGSGALVAPPYRADDWAVEDRRLAALARELRADVFMTTHASSAGGVTATLAVLPPRPTLGQRCPQDEALLLASGFVAFSQGGLRRLRSLRINEGELVVHPQVHDASGRAAAITSALHALTRHVPSEQAARRRSEAEARVAGYADCRRRRSLEQMERRVARSIAAESPTSPYGLAARAVRKGARLGRSLVDRARRLRLGLSENPGAPGDTS